MRWRGGIGFWPGQTGRCIAQSRETQHILSSASSFSRVFLLYSCRVGAGMVGLTSGYGGTGVRGTRTGGTGGMTQKWTEVMIVDHMIGY